MATDMDFVQRVSSEDDYDQLYDASAGKVAGDASAVYFQSRMAAMEIHRRFPRAKILLMLRDPCSSFLSLFQHEQAYGDIRERDPETWFQRLIAEERGIDAETQSFLDIYKYQTNLERYLKYFGEEQIKVILLEDFRKDSSLIMKEVYTFLGLTQANVPTQIVRNAAKAPRYRFLIDLWIHVREKFPSLTRLVKLLTTEKMRGRLWNSNLKPASKPLMTANLRQQVIDYYRAEVEGLARYLNRNLDHWLR